MSPHVPSASPGEPLRELGDRLAEALGRRVDSGQRALLQRLVRRLCRDRAEGHVCLLLGTLPERPDDEGPWPALPQLRAALLGSPGCQTPVCQTDAADAIPAPLVLDRSDRLYLLRDFAAERTIRTWLAARLGVGERRTAAALADSLAALGIERSTSAAEPDWQLAAIAAAARAPFLLLTGGPGTGKTTTVARLLGVLRHHEPDLRIAVCAPTGKAAARLGEALAQRAAAQPELAALGMLQPTTLHRLLGYLPLEDMFRAGPSRRLPFDLVVVDEASMVDPAVLAVLCTALPDDARLVLVGDRDQLAAVAAGQVLGDLCRAAAPERGAGPALGRYVLDATGMQLPVQADAPPIADHVIALQKNHRFGSQPGIAAFAQALARRQPDAALATLRHGHADLVLGGDAETALRAIAGELLAAARTAGSGNHAEATAALLRARVLCALQKGPMGTSAWNRRVEALLAANGLRTDDVWYVGRPILVTANDHQNRIWNGDLGVVVRDHERRPAVLFAQGDGTLRLVPPLRLPAHETAWAMTVHKAQGSEFAHVLLVMPDQPGPLWQASVLYTGITRARTRAILLARDELLADGLRHWPNRASGLAAALRPDG
ncbi:MAG: exodeoxyribonuclease V subunit alpha [Planctomycetes bacterium]|nr:exodeoxyribonuclease V subunit alpha [Planctomycetota bacterium]